MGKNRKPGRGGKSQGMNYAQVLARQVAIRAGLEKAARDATVQAEADAHTQRAMWLMVCSISDAYGYGPKGMQKFLQPSRRTPMSWSECGPRWMRSMFLRNSVRRRPRSPEWRSTIWRTSWPCWQK